MVVIIVFIITTAMIIVIIIIVREYVYGIHLYTLTYVGGVTHASTGSCFVTQVSS